MDAWHRACMRVGPLSNWFENSDMGNVARC